MSDNTKARGGVIKGKPMPIASGDRTPELFVPTDRERMLGNIKPLILTNVYDFARQEDPTAYAKIGNVAVKVTMIGDHQSTYDLMQQFLEWADKQQPTASEGDCTCRVDGGEG